MSLIEKLKKNSTIAESAILEDSRFFGRKDLVPTPIPIFNVLQSGDPNGGFGSGTTIFAGPSKHFKTGFMLIDVAAYLNKFKDAVCLFYDSEFGTPQAYFKRNGIDPARVIHTPIKNIEELKFDIVRQIDSLEVGDKVIIAIDSLGNLASKKEIEDALDQKSVADMTRSKAIKSLFRIITPTLIIKDIPLLAVAHTYSTMEMYSRQVVSGGTGIMYSADNVYILGRQQEKDGDTISGWKFVVNVEKSRFVKEKSKLVINVRYETGPSKYSGLLELAQEFGIVTKPKNGWYTRPTVKGDKNWREDETDTDTFWDPLWKETNFAECITQKYRLPDGEANTAPLDEEV